MVRRFEPLYAAGAAEMLRRMHWDKGLSVLRIAQELGCQRPAVYRAMRRYGIETRSYSAAQYAKNRLLTPEQRAAYASAANQARRGSTDPMERKCRRAQTVQTQAAQRLSKHESRLLCLLREMGADPVPLYAVGPYNIDLAFPAVMLAVEVDGGNWHSTSPHKIAADSRKDDFLRSLGWRIERISSARVGELVAHHLVSLVQQLQTAPSDSS